MRDFIDHWSRVILWVVGGMNKSWVARSSCMAFFFVVLGAALFYALPIALSENQSRKTKYPAHGPDEILIEVRGVPFLIPKGYFRNPRYMREGPASELGLHASLPDINDDGAVVQPEPGYGRYISIGMFPPSVATKMQPGRLYTEQVLWNLIKGKISATNSIPELVKRTFKPELEKIIAEHKDQSGALIPVSHIFGWSTAGTNPDESKEQFYIAFKAGRPSIYTRCHKPVPGKNGSCWAYAHFPEYWFAIATIFDRKYLPLTNTIAERVYARLESFNKHALALLSSGDALRRSNWPNSGEK